MVSVLTRARASHSTSRYFFPSFISSSVFGSSRTQYLKLPGSSLSRISFLLVPSKFLLQPFVMQNLHPENFVAGTVDGPKHSEMWLVVIPHIRTITLWSGDIIPFRISYAYLLAKTLKKFLKKRKVHL